MIFTFGHRRSYNEALRTGAERGIAVNKIGRSTNYPGGSVWRTREEAQAYVDSLPNDNHPSWQASDFAVYGVLADWDTDTYQFADEPWRSLLRDAAIVKIENAP